MVFDLDDTLYPERDYVRSGFCHVANLVERLYSVPFVEHLRAAQQEEEMDVLGAALRRAGLTESLKEHLVLAYRYHNPTLGLHQGAGELLARCHRGGCRLYLVTDGRSVTQRLKIEALGLKGAFEEIFISEEIGCGKPAPKAFESIVSANREGPWVYVADNPSKDFVAPHALGWTTIGVRHLESRVHPIRASAQEPTFWVEELAHLL